MSSNSLLIAGGGIAGLASALALVQRGHQVQVLEAAPAFEEIGAGIQLGPNATRRLAWLDLEAKLAQLAAQPEALAVHSAQTDRALARLPLGHRMSERYGAPYLCVHRVDLHRMLLDALMSHGGAVLECNARVDGIEVDADEVRVRCEDGRSFSADGLVGADGLWSRARTQVVANDAPPRASGHMAWRGLVQQAALPAALRRSQVDVWLGPRLHAVSYPVRGGAALNVVVIAETQIGELVDKPVETRDARSWDRPATLEALRRATGACCGSLQALLEAMPEWRAWSLHDRAPLASSAAVARGRVALVGDAAHPMLPYLAQGAGMAIEDAWALAGALQPSGSGSGNTRVVSSAVHGDVDVPAAWDAYARARWQRNARVQRRARRNGEIFHASGPMRLGRDAVLRSLGARVLDVPWLYSQ
ncbi:MAG: FAD-dependent monooxygenase [Variovorax sp.]